MKFILATVLVASLASASMSSHESIQLSDAMKSSNLAGIDFQTLQKAQCFIPCVEEPIRHLRCDGQGPFQTICSHFNEIQFKARPCIEKCGITTATANLVGGAARAMCATI